VHPEASKVRFREEVARIPASLLAQRGWILHTREFPVLDCSFAAAGRTTLRVRLTCDDWNDTSASIALLDATGTALSQLLPNPTGVFNSSSHPTTGRPFVCMRGSREYHGHPSHLNDPWEPLKALDEYSLGGLLTKLWNAWRKGAG